MLKKTKTPWNLGLKGNKNSLFKVPRSKETRRKISESLKNRKKEYTLERRQKMSLGRKGKLQGSKHHQWKGGLVKIFCLECGKEKMVKPSKIKIGQGKFCSLLCARSFQFKQHKNSGTDIENLIEQELINRHILYMKQVPIKEAHTIPDFLLPDKIVIYCDSKYWHLKKKDKTNRDKKQVSELTKLGYKVYRFWDEEIYKSTANCIDLVFQGDKK